VLSGAGGIAVEPLQEETSEFDVFYFYLKELVDVVDEMEKFHRTDL
jgi:hypothetical protein